MLVLDFSTTRSYWPGVRFWTKSCWTLSMELSLMAMVAPVWALKSSKSRLLMDV
jgi:hypothetical protein